MKTTTGFLLSFLKYGDNDAILHTFTKEHGYKSFFLKGIYYSKNKKKAYLQLFNELDFFYRASSKAIELPHCVQIEPCSIIDITDIKIHSIIFFTADFLNQVLKNEQRNDDIYDLIKALFSQLIKSNFSTHITFCIKLLKSFGIAPLITGEDFLDSENGMFRELQTNKVLTQEVSSLWKQILIANDPYSVHIPSKMRQTLLNSVIQYYQIHFSGFKPPESLEIIRQLRN